MKKILLILLTFISLNVLAQSDSFKVKEGSFHHVQGCVTIPARTDINDLPMGVIKIIPDNINEQQRMRLTFEGNLATDIEVEQHEGETWVYVTARAVTFIRIKHPDYNDRRAETNVRILGDKQQPVVGRYLHRWQERRQDT